MRPAMTDAEVKRIVKKTHDPNDIGKIGQTPGVMGGEPIIAGPRITPDLVWSFYEGGFTTEQIIEQYTHLQSEDAEAAVAYEAKQRRHGGECFSEHRVGCITDKDVRMAPIRFALLSTCLSWSMSDGFDGAPVGA